jgi:RNAse (barnase) inhibitor barstar
MKTAEALMRNLRLISSLFFWSVIVIASISSMKVFAANEASQSQKISRITIDGAHIRSKLQLYHSIYYQIDIRGNDNIEDLEFIISQKVPRPLIISIRNFDVLKKNLGAQNAEDLLKSLKEIQSENSSDITLTEF